MALTLKELLEKRGKVVADIRALHESSEGALSAEDQEKYDRMKGECESYDQQIERAREVESLENRHAGDTDAAAAIRGENYDGRGRDRGSEGGQGSVEESRALALQAWCRSQMGEDLDEAQAAACKRVGINPHAKHLDIALSRQAPRTLAEARALSAVEGAAGGFTAPGTFTSNLEVAMMLHGGMRQVAEIIRTSNGNELAWPTADDTSSEGEIVGESEEVNTQSAAQDQMFDLTKWYAYKFSSKMVKVPYELFEDSAFDLAGILGTMLGERLGRIQNKKFTIGTGAAEPSGIVTDATLGKTTASATALKTDEILELIHSIDPAYRAGAKFMMHDNTLLTLRLLKDGNGQYIWQGGTREGEPDRLFSYPVQINQHMASTVVASAKTILFGQLQKYKIRDVGSIRLRRLVERYAEFDQEGFVAFVRCDGHLLDAGTHPVKYIQQHA
jgi:HK97 family phage major capsid protein